MVVKILFYNINSYKFGFCQYFDTIYFQKDISIF